MVQGKCVADFCERYRKQIWNFEITKQSHRVFLTLRRVRFTFNYKVLKHLVTASHRNRTRGCILRGLTRLSNFSCYTRSFVIADILESWGNRQEIFFPKNSSLISRQKRKLSFKEIFLELYHPLRDIVLVDNSERIPMEIFYNAMPKMIACLLARLKCSESG